MEGLQGIFRMMSGQRRHSASKRRGQIQIVWEGSLAMARILCIGSMTACYVSWKVGTGKSMFLVRGQES